MISGYYFALFFLEDVGCVLITGRLDIKNSNNKTMWFSKCILAFFSAVVFSVFPYNVN